MNTTYFINLVAGNVFQTQTTPTIPSALYIGLSTTAPTAAGGNVSEPSSSAGYAREALTSLSTPSSGVVSNTAAIEFNESTGSWGTITHFVIYDALTGGNLLMYGHLKNASGEDESRTVEAATIMMIRTGTLTLSVLNPS